MKGLTVVIPSLNEGAQLARTVAEVHAALAGIAHEIVVIDDGSRDGSAACLEADDVRVARHPEPMGYGYSIKEGVRLARHDLVGIIDADRTYDAKDLLRLVDALGDLDMAVGVRPAGKNQGSPLRRGAKWLLRRFAEYLAGSRIPDLNSGIRVFRRDLALQHERLLPNGFSFTTTITLAVLADGRPVAYLPVSYGQRDGKSHIQPLRDLVRIFGLVLRTGCMIRPLKVFLPIGGLLLAAAASRLAYDVFILHDIGDSSTLFLTSGLEVALMGLLAELVVRRR